MSHSVFFYRWQLLTIYRNEYIRFIMCFNYTTPNYIAISKELALLKRMPTTTTFQFIIQFKAELTEL